MKIEKTPPFNLVYMFILTTLPILSRYQFGPLDLDVIMILLCIPFFLFASHTLTITSVGKPALFIIFYVGTIHCTVL